MWILNFRKHRKTLCIVGLLFLILLNVSMLASAKDVGVDLEKDLRLFDREFLDDHIDEADFDDLEALNDVYDTLNKNWDQIAEGEVEKIPDEDYRTYDHTDITKITIKNLDEDNATFTVNVVGDPEDTSHPWWIYVWSDCGEDVDDESMLVLFGFYLPGGLNGEDWNAYISQFGGDNTTGEMDIGSNDDGGHDISVDFPSEWWEETEDCDLRVMMITTQNDEDLDDDSNLVMDIYPDNPECAFDWLFWLIIIIIIVIIALASYLVIKHYREKSKTKRVVK